MKWNSTNHTSIVKLSNEMKHLILLSLLSQFVLDSHAQSSDFDKINMNIPGISISSKSDNAGNVMRSYKTIPDNIDSYAEQKITGITVIVDKNGSLARVAPIYHKLELISLNAVIKKINEKSSIQDIFRMAHYTDLTEIQRLALLKKIAIAILASDDDLNIKFDENEKKIIEQTLKPYSITIENHPAREKLISFAKLVLNKVSIE